MKATVILSETKSLIDYYAVCYGGILHYVLNDKSKRALPFLNPTYSYTMLYNSALLPQNYIFGVVLHLPTIPPFIAYSNITPKCLSTFLPYCA